MLKGSFTVRMDEKGRIKLPASYRRYIEERSGVELYVTSLYGNCARVYPIQEWMIVEEKLKLRGTSDASVRKFLDVTNYYGQLAEMDQQGRVLIHPRLRGKAELVGDVTVLGYLQYLEVWELDKFESRMAADPFTAEDAANLAALGI